MCEGHYPFCTCIALLQLYYPFALALPLFALALPIICTCITLLHLKLPICTCITRYLPLPYPLFALALPFCTWNYPFALALTVICTCITHYLPLHYPLFALELPICTWITHLYLHYPFALALPICYFFCTTHYPSIASINNTHNYIINCKALQHVILGMVLSSNNKWSQHRLLRARSARDWWLQVFTHFIHT